MRRVSHLSDELRLKAEVYKSSAVFRFADLLPCGPVRYTVVVPGTRKLPDRGAVGQSPVDVAADVTGNHVVHMWAYVSAFWDQGSNFSHRVPENIPDLWQRYPLEAIPDLLPRIFGVCQRSCRVTSSSLL